ncbi:MAG: hypothetical protein WCI27_06770, partial [Candidatus Omnitrophota bacterium]
PILQQPKYGFGSAHNPCIDCHIYMVKKAAAYMKEIGADFVFTGEVLGQRPMSQRRQCLEWVELDGAVEGRLLRPLCAKLLPPTIPEQEGLVDRGKLMGISGRSRKPQYRLVKELGLEGFSAPGGGCLLTEKVFGARLKDILGHGCPDIASTAVLVLGRYLRLDAQTFVLVGRDAHENEELIRRAMPSDMILRSFVFPGPAALVRGKNVSEEQLALAAGLVQFHSKSRGQGALPLFAWRAGAPADVREVMSVDVPEADVKRMLF